MKKSMLLLRLKEFCSDLDKKDRVALLHHSDPDGFCSAAIVLKALKKLTGKMPVVIENYEYADNKRAKAFLKKAAEKKTNKLIILDISIDGDPNWKRLVKPFEKVLIIDHHKLYEDLSSKKTIFIKAQFVSKREPSSYPCSKLCFDLVGKCAKISNADWIACIGIIGDKGYPHWKPFFKKTMKRTGLDLFTLTDLTYLVGATEVMAREKMNSLLLLFFEAKSPKEILRSPFSKYLEKMKMELDRQIWLCMENALFFPELELVLYETRTVREGIKSYVVNELSELSPNRTVILIQDSGKKYLRVSARRQDCRIKMNELLERSIRGIPDANGGGHIPAAAARIPKRFESKFKKNLMKTLKRMVRK